MIEPHELDLDLREQSSGFEDRNTTEMRDQYGTELRDQHPTELRSDNAPVENNNTEIQGINSRIKVRTKVNSPSGDRKKLVKKTITNLI